jgi:toxin ParE1/3/4
MTSSVLSYELSPEAAQDLSDIFDYTEMEFGLDQAVKYLKDLEHCFIQLCGNPSIGRERSEIREALYSFLSQSHVVFYRILNDRLRVVRVLHGSRDLPRHF